MRPCLMVITHTLIFLRLITRHVLCPNKLYKFRKSMFNHLGPSLFKHAINDV